jgi:hypothetical protein
MDWLRQRVEDVGLLLDPRARAYAPRRLALKVRQGFGDAMDRLRGALRRRRGPPATLRAGAAAAGLDLREFDQGRCCVTPVRNQGRSPWCGYFAVLAGAEARALVQDTALPTLDLSENDLVATGRSTTHSAALKAARRAGVVAESDYVSGRRTPGAGVWSVEFATLSGSTRQKQEEMKARLRRGEPLIAVLTPDATFFRKDVPLPYRRTDRRRSDLHAVCIVGYREEPEGQFWVFKNSYGVEWGKDGYGTVAFGDPCEPELDVTAIVSVTAP